MKRTRQRFDRPAQEEEEYVSGCRQFEGEDLLHNERMARHAAQQKEWIEQQKREHAEKCRAEAEEEQQWADQDLAHTRMRGMLDDEMNMKRAAHMKALQEENKRMAQAKRDNEKRWKENQERSNQFEIARTNASDIMTENRDTCENALKPGGRYVPYHFKGLRPDQIADIEAQRANQVRERRQIEAQEREEENAWAAQATANAQFMLANEVTMKQQYADMNQGMKATHKVDKVAKDQRWPNAYGDLNALPDVQRDMDSKARVSFAQ